MGPQRPKKKAQGEGGTALGVVLLSRLNSAARGSRLANHTTPAGGALLANVRLHPVSTSIVAERVRQEREQGASLRGHRAKD